MPKGRVHAQVCYSRNREAHRRGWLGPPARFGGARKGLSEPLFDSRSPLRLNPSGATVMAKDMSGAEMVIHALTDQGVQHVFGYPGGAVLPIYDAIFSQE